MQAVFLDRCGPPEVVRIRDIPMPVAGDDEVLLRIRAASINPLDWHGMRGKPYIARLMGGVGSPKDPRLGLDVAGQVETAGKNVTQFKPGDEVFGMCKRALGEYACARAAGAAQSGISFSALAAKPASLRYEQAAAVPVAGVTALQGLRNKGRIQPGQRVLINGAAGGVGTFAVQIAKWLGADVTGVCSTRNVELVESLGADRVIDYTRQDFATEGQRYDLFFDCAGNRTLSSCRRVLSGGGTLVVAAGPDGPWLGPISRLITTMLVSPFVKQNLVPFIASARQADLVTLGELIESGKVKPVIDKCYKLAEAAEALRYLESRHARGKVVITIP
jgi:NADPH:quinone reductase-like Zn-dependent oxidoreductase